MPSDSDSDCDCPFKFRPSRETVSAIEIPPSLPLGRAPTLLHELRVPPACAHAHAARARAHSPKPPQTNLHSTAVPGGHLPSFLPLLRPRARSYVARCRRSSSLPRLCSIVVAAAVSSFQLREDRTDGRTEAPPHSLARIPPYSILVATAPETLPPSLFLSSSPIVGYHPSPIPSRPR